jgi:hypothetical protein
VVAGMAANNVALADRSIAVGGANAAGFNIRMTGPVTGGPGGAQQVIYADPTFQPDITNAARVFTANPITANNATPYTTGQVVSYLAGAGAKGLNHTVNLCIGFFAQAGTWMGNTNYGFYSNLELTGTSAAPTTWSFFSASTAPNFFNGNVRIGTQTQGIIGFSVFDVVGRAMFTGAGVGEQYQIALRHSTSATTFLYLGATATGDFHVSQVGGVAMFTVSQTAGSIGNATLAGNTLRISTASTQANSAAAGNVGDIRWDDSFLYVRISSGWRRIALGAAF